MVSASRRHRRQLCLLALTRWGYLQYRRVHDALRLGTKLHQQFSVAVMHYARAKMLLHYARWVRAHCNMEQHKFVERSAVNCRVARRQYWAYACWTAAACARRHRLAWSECGWRAWRGRALRSTLHSIRAHYQAQREGPRVLQAMAATVWRHGRGLCTLARWRLRVRAVAHLREQLGRAHRHWLWLHAAASLQLESWAIESWKHQSEVPHEQQQCRLLVLARAWLHWKAFARASFDSKVNLLAVLEHVRRVALWQYMFLWMSKSGRWSRRKALDFALDFQLQQKRRVQFAMYVQNLRVLTLKARTAGVLMKWISRVPAMKAFRKWRHRVGTLRVQAVRGDRLAIMERRRMVESFDRLVWNMRCRAQAHAVWRHLQVAGRNRAWIHWCDHILCHKLKQAKQAMVQHAHLQSAYGRFMSCLRLQQSCGPYVQMLLAHMTVAATAHQGSMVALRFAWRRWQGHLIGMPNFGLGTQGQHSAGPTPMP